MALVIVELQIISTFALVAISWWADALTFFAVAVILVAIFLIIGIFLPAKMDLTLDIAVLFIIAFIFLIVASFVLLFELLVWRTAPYAYLVVELSVTLTILVFVMYHAQTINGNRFAEMRLNDFYLGSLILFHDFLIIFWLTFYWQVFYRPTTPDSWIETSTPIEYYHSLNRTEDRYMKPDWDSTTEPSWTDTDWITRSYDDDDDNEQGNKLYPDFPRGPGREGKQPEYENRNPFDGNPFDRRRPDNRDFTIDWSVYNQRPKNGFRTRGRSRTVRPEPNGVHHAHRNPDEWDPEYITQGAERDVPFDDRPGEPHDSEHLPPNQDIGPRMDSSDDRSVYRHGESISRQPTPKDEVEPRIKDDDAEGKPTAGLDNPTFDFPLADYQPNDSPSMGTTKEVYKSKGSPNIYIVPKAPIIGNHEYPSGAENSYLLSNDPLSHMQEQEKLETFTRSSEIFNHDPQDPGDFNLLSDEMREHEFSSIRPHFTSKNAPPWEELSRDEIMKLLGKQVPEDRNKYRTNLDRWVEPIITREPYPINMPDYEKLVMNESASILI
ncbi:uncharacterized protein LOC108030514 isoform X2 [Drosophila biarmipes]|nr:uncharacterized protein LOC108030514 isoform X2 [Drosophila biarmipes]